ncbi:polysaccharide deacetylase family protein [Lederbergia citrea]|uniref:Polysaccharide deacetylase n=1 Tax=Lederbergia citrea TaxID=2833581 RepID=A0A942URZ6_9BACI|nr:polysaccharide deacetylase [Lederbergia citrea]MBS4224552.1 polysaccharide deacetylase [Lederbergia citrea]
MKKTPRKRLKLTRLGKITAGVLILLVMLLIYFLLGGIDGKNAEAGKGKQITAESKMMQNEGEVNKSKNETILIDKEKNNEIDSNKGISSKDNHKIIEPSGDKKKKVKHTAKKQSNEQATLKTGKVVYLTFDDGPNPVSLDILKLLKTYNAKATFFMLEPNMRKNPKVVKKMVKEGHTVGVHGVTHDVSKVYRSPANFVDEMKQAIGFIQETTNVKTNLVRAPYGSKPYITPPFQAAADQEDFILWDWNIDSIDWKLTNGEYIQKVKQQTMELTDKEPLIVLMHEKDSTLAHLEDLLTFFKEEGYEMEALNETMDPVQLK